MQHVMIQTEGCELLNRVRKIDWLKGLVVYFINEEKESSMQFGKVSFHQCSFMPQITQSFPHQIPKFSNFPSPPFYGVR